MLPEVLVQANLEITDLRAQLEELLPRWQELEVPVIVIQGEKDRLAPVANADSAVWELTAPS